LWRPRSCALLLGVTWCSSRSWNNMQFVPSVSLCPHSTSSQPFQVYFRNSKQCILSFRTSSSKCPWILFHISLLEEFLNQFIRSLKSPAGNWIVISLNL
jgi:hypothetical protein